MHLLFLTHYFPPEVNAPASRTFENARRWVKAGQRVTVLTCAPSHPRGIVYAGYRNALWQWETLDGIRVLRVMTYLSANKGFLGRILNYLSYMVAATLLSTLVRGVDLVVSTSPQFFCGMAGLWVARLKGRPWVLEIRDLWPESIIAVGAIRSRRVIRLLEGLETFLYRQADHLVSVTHSFREHIMGRGVPGHRISVITNGADLEQFNPLPKENVEQLRLGLGLNGKFLASYIGTHGMAHGLDTVLEAARILQRREDICFLLVGDGADRDALLRKKQAMGLDNVLMMPQQPKETMPSFLAASDACMVLLKRNELFKTVIPSKIFEAMAMERPVILGVEGESRSIIEAARCGVCIEPESAEQLAAAVLQMRHDPGLVQRLGSNGRRCAVERYSRDRLASDYLEVLQTVR